MNNVPLGRRNGRSPLGGFLCRWRCENLLLFPPICTPGSRSAAISVLHKSFWRGTKYDAFRAVCYLERRRNRLISRNNNIMTRFDAASYTAR